MTVNESLQTARRKTLTGLVLLAFFVALRGPWPAQAEPPQAGAAQKPAPPAAQPATKAKAKTPAKTATPAAKPAAKTKVKTPAKTATTEAAAKKPKEKKAAKASTAKKKKAAGGGAPPVTTSARGTVGTGLRDPFRIPTVGVRGGEVVETDEIKGPLPPGTRGLVIGQLRLEGTVRQDTSNTMIAVVTNFTNRAYFLRENDTVYNGMVSKISPDSIVFRQNYLDPNGRVQTREVVRRLGPGAGEGR